MSVNEHHHSEAAAWYALFLLFLAYAIAWLDRQILTLLIPAIKADLALSDTQISLLQGFAFSLLYTMAGIPIARLADRQSRRRIIAIGMAVWSVMTALCGLAKSFPALFAARMGVGIGEAALSPSAYSLIADLFPPRKHATAYALFQVGSTIGGGLAMILGGALIAWLAGLDLSAVPALGNLANWQIAFIAVGLPGVFCSLLFITAVEPQRRPRTRSDRFDDSVFRYLRAHRSRYTSLFLAVGLLGLLSIGTAAWYPTFLMRIHSFTPAQAGYCYGSILLVAGSLGIVAGGHLSDWLIARGMADANIRIMQYSTALKLVPLIVGPLLADIRGVVAMLALATFIGQLSSGVAIACLQAATPDQYRARVSAVMLFVVNLLAIGLGATYVALITDRIFADEMAIHYSLALAAATVGPLILVLLWFYRRESGDAAAADAGTPILSTADR
jgi:predicted MFS family arabinose efflux permease